jgi:phenylpyruvate tautomerase PptA (4-oxalocrotonate tautomerase family)
VAIIEVKAYARRFEDEEKAAQLIAALTDAFGEVYGEDAKRGVEVILQGIEPRLWAIGGVVNA